MSARQERVATEEESRQLVEDNREIEWKGRACVKEMFEGGFPLDLIHPFPVTEEKDWRPEFREFYDGMKKILAEKVDPVEIDKTGEYPEEAVQALKEIGAFGMKVPTEYGGLGLTQVEYNTVMEMVGSYDGNVTALLSAHQSIGVPQPLKLFGSPELKQKYLPRVAKGAISAFALTEPHVGSDPAAMSTTAEPTEDGEAYLLNGEKMWCTNGTLAELLVVMARNPQTGKISAFIVECDWEGVKVEYRCRFMGLKALANGVISFNNVRVPKENLVGQEGRGLKIALVTLNTGRLTLPAACAGMAKQMLEIVTGWSNERATMGKTISHHEAIAHHVADMAADTFAMESVSDLASHMADRGGYDIRLEAAAAKEWNTVRAWEMIDTTLQIRGGRGYETEESLAGRGERAMPVERVMRDCRINLIFEGSSEIMHLFMAREAVDMHLKIAGTMIDPKASLLDKAKAVPAITLFYVKWYLTLLAKGFTTFGKYSEFGSLAKHLRFVERSCRRLARNSFHGMALYQAKMEKKQAFLFRCVDIVMELFAIAASVSRAQQMKKAGHPEAAKAAQLADLFASQSERKVRRLFQDLWAHDDALKNKVAKSVFANEQRWLLDGRYDLELSDEDFKTVFLTATEEDKQPQLKAVS